ncbi:MAG: serine/threonine protein kinase [Actinomycetota bacterium]|nr:serine/threonine protein kinase [Actinomycetota bacterium]
MVSSDPLIGAVIGSYTVESRLGVGGMGVVYIARQDQPRRHVALKMMLKEVVESDSTFRSRFLRESQVAAELEHPNIVPIYGAGEDGDILYLAMRYIRGGDLRLLLKGERRIALRRALALLSPVAGALDFAHHRGLIHRDVKPGNILIDKHERSEHPYLTDFGVTKALGSTTLTKAGGIIGSADYMAPEQAGSSALTGAVDVYSLACVLYQCLAGQVPFKREGLAARLSAHIHDSPPALSALCPDLPRSIDAAIQRAMAKDPAQRYGSCVQFLEAVEHRLGPSVTGATRSSDRSGTVTVSDGEMASTRVEESTTRQRDLALANELALAAAAWQMTLSGAQMADRTAALTLDERVLSVAACRWKRVDQSLPEHEHICGLDVDRWPKGIAFLSTRYLRLWDLEHHSSDISLAWDDLYSAAILNKYPFTDSYDVAEICVTHSAVRRFGWQLVKSRSKEQQIYVYARPRSAGLKMIESLGMQG